MRVPYGNFTPFRLPDDCEIEDENLVLISDAMSTAYWSVDNAGVKPGDTIIILGCGPVGLLAQKFPWLKGVKRVIAVDYIDYRLEHAKKYNKVETLNFERYDNTGEYLKEITHGGALGAIIMATQAVRKCGTIQITGAYGARYNGFPLGDIMNRNINIRTGQAPVIPYMSHLYDLLAKGTVNPGDIITHKLPLNQAEHGMECNLLTPHETIELHELITFKNVCLTKSISMSILVSDNELKSILKQDAVTTQKHIEDLLSLMGKPSIATPTLS